MTKTHRTSVRFGVAALVAGLAVSTGVAGITEAGAAGRVDTGTPVFTHPTRITNPLFPITATRQMVSLGNEGDTALRQETTLLDRTRTIRVGGRDVKVVVSQFVAYADGRIAETAIDYFAQADDGSVWYFGEDVTNYEDGVVTDHDGTWLAGRDGPPGMIMPAHPKVGDVYRPENIPGLVFEETTVRAVGLTVNGPSGPVTGAIRVEEHPAAAAVETKVFAPGYGEFDATVPDDDEHVRSALAIPTDQRRGREPGALDRLSDAGQLIARGARADSWAQLDARVGALHHEWDELARTPLPPLLSRQMRRALRTVDRTAAARDRTGLTAAALDVESAALDLELQYGDIEGVDRDRVTNVRRQRALHRTTGDAAGVASDTVVIATITDRITD